MNPVILIARWPRKSQRFVAVVSDPGSVAIVKASPDEPYRFLYITFTGTELNLHQAQR